MDLKNVKTSNFHCLKITGPRDLRHKSGRGEKKIENVERGAHHTRERKIGGERARGNSPRSKMRDNDAKRTSASAHACTSVRRTETRSSTEKTRERDAEKERCV